MEEKQVKYKRKHFLINKSFQLKFMARIFLAIFFMIFVLSTAILIMNTQTLSDSETKAVDSARSALTKIAEIKEPIFKLKLTRDNLKGNIVKIFFVTVIFSILLVIAVFLMISHRIVGPMFVFRRNIRAMRDGDLSVRIILRGKDEMQDIADDFNSMAISLNQRMYQIQNLTSDIKKEIKEGKVGKSDTLNKKINELEESINQFKIVYN